MVHHNDAIGGLGRFLMGLEAQCTALICVFFFFEVEFRCGLLLTGQLSYGFGSDAPGKILVHSDNLIDKV